jgi:predicted transport protein
MADMESVAVARKGVAAAYKDWLKETYSTQLSEMGRNTTRDKLPDIGPGGAWAEVGIQSKPSAWIVEFSRDGSGAWTASLPQSNYPQRLGGSFNSRSPLQGVLSRVLPVVRVSDEPRRAEPHAYWEWALVFVFPGRPAFQAKGSSGGVIEFDPVSGQLSSPVEGEDIKQPYVESGLFKLVPDDEHWSNSVDLTYRDATEALSRLINVEHAAPPEEMLDDDDSSDEDADVDGGSTFTNRQSLEYRLQRSPPQLLQLLADVKARIEQSGRDVMEVPTLNYFAYKSISETNFACVEVYPTRGIRIFLKVDPTTVEMESGFTREAGDDSLLRAMRTAYQTSWPTWGAVWRIFGEIRSALRIADDDFAFVNLARCPDPTHVTDDKAIVACQQAFPLDDLIEALDARVVFLAKSGPVGRNIHITGEGDERIIIRYANGSRGSRPGAAHYTQWLPKTCVEVRRFMLVTDHQPRRFMLDTNIYDEIVAVPGMSDRLNGLSASGDIIILQTHVQRDELENISDEQKKAGVLKIAVTWVLTSGAVYGTSKWGQATWGAGAGEVKIEDVRSDSAGHVADALIATTAAVEADVLVTEDRRLTKRVNRVSHLPVWPFSEFRSFVEARTCP